MKVVTSGEMRAIEAAAVERGDTFESLMQRAGEATGGRAEELLAGPALILCGPGNNGGDGLVAAEWLRRRDHGVVVYAFARREMRDYAGPVVHAEDDPELEELHRLVSSSSVIVDALLGIGQNRPVEGLLAAIIRVANESRQSKCRAIAVDIPTGVNADTGALLGEAFHAHETICMGFAKVGALLYPGAAYARRARVEPLEIPRELAANVKTSAHGDDEIARLLPVRTRNSNKGTFGRLLIIAGSRDFMGAPALCSMSACRAGTGLVEVAALPEVRRVVASHAAEPVFADLPEEDGKISPTAIPSIRPLLGKASALAYGPGIGLSGSTIELTRGLLVLLRERAIPTVLDADGLNALSNIPDWWRDTPEFVLTPHPGEMGRLTDLSVTDIQGDRLGVARHFAAEWQKVVVLKGAGTIVASPDGEAVINTTGGPNLAAAGTGDVLTGLIGGLLAQGLSHRDAAVAGVYLHGKAGDLLMERLGDSGTVASDLPPTVPRARLAVLRSREGEE